METCLWANLGEKNGIYWKDQRRDLRIEDRGQPKGQPGIQTEGDVKGVSEGLGSRNTGQYPADIGAEGEDASVIATL